MQGWLRDEVGEEHRDRGLIFVYIYFLYIYFKMAEAWWKPSM
jgi:hypothetical protein